MFEDKAKWYRQKKQAYIKWDGDGSHGLARIGTFELDPETDRITDVIDRRFIDRPAEAGEKSRVTVTQARKALRHLPYGSELELYLGSLPREEKERFLTAFPEAKEIQDD